MDFFFLDEGIPTEAECRSLWLRFGVPDEVIVHSRIVAEFARILALYLKRAGLTLNVDLVIAGGYLYDLVKGRPDHAGVGARILEQMGYARVSELAAPHMNPSGPDGVLNEADLIFLAGQCIEEDRLGSLCGTCKAPLNPHKYPPEDVAEIISRVNRAGIIKDRVEKLLGISLRSIIQKHGRGIQAVSVQGIRNVYLLMHGSVGLKTDAEYLTAQELPLSPEGIHQAGALSEDLLDVPLSNIYCSDLKSAIETATIIAEPHRIEPDIRGGLREISVGEWCGSTSAEVHQLYSRQFGHDMMHFRPPGGETLFECTTRVIPAFYDILNSTFGNMAIVGHAVVNRIILCQVLGLSLERLFELDQGYGRLNHIYCDGPNMRLKSMNGDERPSDRFN
ncbi:MAG: histidine phosphatase family protein [Syntrophobacteraceae bacterium]|jgi:probable phosphoglycerate mutase